MLIPSAADRQSARRSVRGRRTFSLPGAFEAREPAQVRAGGLRGSYTRLGGALRPPHPDVRQRVEIYLNSVDVSAAAELRASPDDGELGGAVPRALITPVTSLRQ